MIHGVFGGKVEKLSSRTSLYLEDVLIILIILMVIMVSGTISIELDLA